MKKNLKYLNTVFLLCSIGCIFMSMFELGYYEITGGDLIRLAYGQADTSSLVQTAVEYVREYFQQIAFVIIIIIVFSCISVLVSVNQKGKTGYVITSIFSFCNMVCVNFIYSEIRDKTTDIKNGLSWVGAVSSVEVNDVMFILWTALYIVVIGISVVAIYTMREKKDIDPEDDWTVITDIIEEIDFHGVIVGKKGIYRGMAYPLKEKREVFFKLEDELLEISEFEETKAITGIYYISEYQEYCVDVQEKTAVFLMSGQPLGAGKKYYLPRGTEIYIKDKSDVFELA